MFKPLSLLVCVFFSLPIRANADVLIVADEFPAMEYLARQLKSQEGVTSQLVVQTNLPADLAKFEAVVLYIHLGLSERAERSFIEYAEAGGRLVLLHHSVSSGKRQNRFWFPFLGVELPQRDSEQGGYKWIEGVTVEWRSLSSCFITTNRVDFTQFVSPSAAAGATQPPSFTLTDTEVYLNHVLTGPRISLLALHYTDAKTGREWDQETAGWLRPAGKGWVLYLMPGHSVHDFENPIYGRIVLNAITAPRAQLQ